MSWNLVPLGQVPPTPWANGGGVTRELLAWPRSEDWTVRLSVAEIAKDGPFSQLPGVRRWFAVLSGQGVKLQIDAVMHELGTSSMPLQFEGAAPTDCELRDGPTRDFNLMLRRGTARMERLYGALSQRGKAAAMVAVYAQHGVTVRCEGECLTIPPDTLAWRILDSDGLFELAGDDALWMEIDP